MIKFKEQLVLEDFKKAQKLHLQIGPFSVFANYYLLLGGLIAIIIGLSLILTGRIMWSLILVLFVVLGGMGVFMMVRQQGQVARTFQQQKDLSAPVELALDETGYSATSVYGSVHIPWGDFAKWKENQELFLLYRSDVLISVLPKRFLAGEEEARYVRDLLTRNGVPDARTIGQRGRLLRMILGLLLVIVVMCAAFVVVLVRSYQ